MLANLLILVIAALHLYFLLLEMFWWRTERAMKAFGTTPEFAAASATLAANQGLYNGFLAAGLLWGVLSANQDFKLFFLLCVLIAGVYGGLTANRRILFIQALPALLALIVLLLKL